MGKANQLQSLLTNPIIETIITRVKKKAVTVKQIEQKINKLTTITSSIIYTICDKNKLGSQQNKKKKQVPFQVQINRVLIILIVFFLNLIMWSQYVWAAGMFDKQAQDFK